MFCVTAGLGVSCNYLTAQAMAGVMFHDIRGLALSAVSISGAAGTAVFPLLLRYLANVYTLRGTFLVLAAFNFQMVLCGMLIGLFAHRERSGTVDQRVREGRVETKTAVEDCIVQYPSQRQRSDCLEELTPLSTGVETCCPEDANHNITELVEEAGELGLDELTPLSTGVETCCPEDANHNTTELVEEAGELGLDELTPLSLDVEMCCPEDANHQTTELVEEAEEHPGGMASSRSALNDAGRALSDVSRDDICRKPSAVTASEERKHSAQDTQMDRNCKHHAGNGEVGDVVKEENVLCLPKRHAHPPSPDKALSISAKKAVTSEIPFEKTEEKSNTAVFSCASEKPDESSRRFFSERRRGSRQNFFACFRGSSWLSFAIFRNTSCLQLEILRMPKFILVILLGFTVMMSFIQPSLFMTDMMKSKRLTVQDGTFFIFMIFSGNIAGRTLAGVLYQLHKSGILIVYSMSIVMCGMTSFCYLFAVEYVHFLAVSLFFGISFGIYIATTPMVILEILGPGRFTVGMGYSYFLGGVTLLVAGPYGGQCLFSGRRRLSPPLPHHHTRLPDM